MEHRRIAPSADLAAYVAHFWWVSWDLAEPIDVETLPHPTVHFVFESSSEVRTEVRGVATRRFTRQLEGRGRVFGIKLRPAAFSPLWPRSVAELTDRIVGLARVLGGGTSAWGERIAAAASVESAISLAEPFLRRRLPPLPTEVARVRDLVERMERDRGLARVEDVAAWSGASVRTLERAFRAHVGVGPKWVLQRYRLHEAAARLVGARPPSLARLARELGYCDQAHFTRDFKRFVGRPPGEVRG